MVMEILKASLEAVEDVEAVIVVVAIKEARPLMVYPPAEQTALSTPTQANIAGIPASTVIR